MRKKEESFDSTKRDFVKKCLTFSAGIATFPCASAIDGIIPSGQEIYRKPAMFQEETPKGIMCRICPNECVLREGEVSDCRNRVVRDTKLYTMAYGNPCSANIDPIEKKPLYHFYPGSRAYSIATAGCNMACLNCQNWTISQASPDKTRNYDLPPAKVVEESIRNKCRSIAYTYSEPNTFYEYAWETAGIAKRAGVKNIFKSNGYINPEPLRKMCSVLDAANIDLKSFSDSTYVKLTGGKLQPVLDSLRIYREMGVWLEITHLIVPTWTDDPDETGKMCKWLSENGFRETPIHFSRFYPTHKLEQLPPTPVDVLRNAARIASAEGLKYVYIGNVPGNEMSDTICPSCGAAVLSRQGYRITAYKISGGKCINCGGAVSGIWE